jgi:hypothetical protein
MEKKTPWVTSTDIPPHIISERGVGLSREHGARKFVRGDYFWWGGLSALLALEIHSGQVREWD